MNSTSKELDAAIDRLMRIPEPPKCGACLEPIESWWSYCAMCGKHLAAGNETASDHQQRMEPSK